MEVLQFPYDGQKKDFFYDFPVVGKASRLKRHFNNILKDRTPDVLKIWKLSEEGFQVLTVLNSLIYKIFEWPNCIFLPNDKCNVLLWDMSGDLLAEEFLTNIDHIFKVNTDKDCNLISNSTFEELIDYILKKSVFYTHTQRE